MRREAHCRQSLWFKGQWADEYFYAILRHEWEQRRSAASGHSLSPNAENEMPPRQSGKGVKL